MKRREKAVFRPSVCLCTLLTTMQVAMVGNAQEANASAVQSVISDLAEAEAKLAALNVAVQFQASSRFICEQMSNAPEARIYYEDDAVKVRMESKVLWEIRMDGSRRLKVTSEKTNIRSDDSQIQREEVIISTFDGKRGLARLSIRSQLPDGNITEQEKVGSTFFDSQYPGHDLISELARSSVSEQLGKGKATLIGEEVWKGRTILILKTLPRETVAKKETYLQVWVDPERKVAVRQKRYGRSGGQNRWELVSQIDCESMEHNQTFDIWLPRTMHAWKYGNANGKYHRVREEHVEFETWNLGAELADMPFFDDFTFD